MWTVQFVTVGIFSAICLYLLWEMAKEEDDLDE